MSFFSLYGIVLTLFLLVTGCAGKKIAQLPIKSFPKPARQYLSGMRSVPGGKFTGGYCEPLIATEQDSTLLICSRNPESSTLDSYYISDHEVTNKEYGDFVRWVKDSLILTKLAEYDPGYYKDKATKSLNWSRSDEIGVFYHYRGNDKIGRDTVKANIVYRIERAGDDQEDTSLQRKQLETIVYSYRSLEGYTIQSPICPDKLVFYKDFPFSLHDATASAYLWHEQYYNCPIVGVSWDQANAYCHWRTQQFRNAILTQKRNIQDLKSAVFRLPTESEWEYTAVGTLIDVGDCMNDIRIFPWKGRNVQNLKGKYLANFGQTHDQNDFDIKQHIDDGEYYPVAAKTYPCNDIGLYNIAGNMAEWTANVAENVKDFSYFYAPRNKNDLSSFDSLRIIHKTSEDSILKLIRISSFDNQESAIKKEVEFGCYIQNLLDSYRSKHRDGFQSSAVNDYSIFIYSNTFRNTLADKILQDAKTLAKWPDARIVKGGSWASGPAYMQIGAREIFSRNRSSSRIGFRVAMSVPKPAK